MKSPIFIFSLPRSGSTLLQRILMGHPKIASVAEPWLLLPFLYTTKREGLLAEYSHSTCHKAIKDLINNLPNKQKDYNRFLREFANNIYSSYCNDNEIFFLDKTPRYYLIISEIATLFPDAKFIFLFRNPVHIYSSILNTWGKNRFINLSKNHIDLNRGPKMISEGYELLKNKSYMIQYEQLLREPENSIIEILNYLELDNNINLLKIFHKQDTKGSMGDPLGTKNYKKIVTSPLNKWESIFSTVLRKKIIKNYIQNIDEKVLLVQGYSKNKILQDISRLPTNSNKFLIDSVDYSFAFLVRRLKLNLYFEKDIKKWSLDKNIS
jgi:hypothetical protein